ncbi:hypothetical protein [Rhizobium leguminosarum]|nr:hypothetical protein [Rhizobium leguminosarum]
MGKCAGVFEVALLGTAEAWFQPLPGSGFDAPELSVLATVLFKPY